MAVQSEIFSTEYGVRSFISTKHIATKQHMAVWLQRSSDNIWVQLSTSNYELINNSAVLTQAPNSTTYSQVEIRVADTPDELGSSQSEIAVLAGLHDEIVALNGIKNDITTVAGISGDVTTVSSNILDINSVVTNIVPNLAEILQADTNATIATTKAGEASASATSASNSATSASNSATSASNQATIATTKASEASASATSASNSATTATTKASEASASATSASASATSASNSANIATTQAGIATTKAEEASYYATITNYAIVETLAELEVLDTTQHNNICIVKDKNRGGTFVWSATGTANGGTVFAGVSGYWNRQYYGAVNVKWFGAKGGFDPQNADSSLNSVESFQKAIDFCVKHKLNLTTDKDSFLIKRNGAPFNSSLYIGNYEATDLDVLNITIDLQGSTLYQGDLGSLFIVAKVEGVEFKNINYVGYATDSNWHPSRENFGLMRVVYSSSNITINSCSFRNFMGDAVYIGGTLVAEGELGEQCHNIIIKNCTFKERLGNNIRPWLSGGTRSRLAISCITAEKVKIFDNIFYGAIDFEPNLDNQVLRDIEVINNTFYDLKVIPHSTLNNWEEEIHSESGELILNNIIITGVAGRPIIENALFSNNTFDTGTISIHPVYKATVSYNRFRSGTINIGSLSGPGNISYASIIGNESYSPYNTDGFLRILGDLTLSLISSNLLTTGNLIHVIPEVDTLNKCVFCNNSVMSSTGTLSNINLHTFPYLVLANNTSVDGVINHSIFTGIETRSLVTPLVTLNIDSTSPLTLDMRSQAISQASKLFIVPPSATSVTINDLIGGVNGQTLTIMSGGSGAGGNLIMNSGKFKHKAGGSLTLVSNQCVSYMHRAGFWWEI